MSSSSLSLQVVSLGITSFTLCALGIDRFHAATSSSQPKARRVERCRSVLLKLLLVWLGALLLSSPEIFLWQLSQAVSPSTGRLVDSCTITTSSPLSLYLPDSLHSLLLRYHQVSLSSVLKLSDYIIDIIKLNIINLLLNSPGHSLSVLHLEQWCSTKIWAPYVHSLSRSLPPSLSVQIPESTSQHVSHVKCLVCTI